MQEQQATSAQANLVTLQAAYSDLKAKHNSSVAAQAAAEQRLSYSASELKALQTEHATHQAEFAAVSADRNRMTQAQVAHAAELSQMQRELSTSQVQLENSKELHRQVQEKLTAHEAGLTQLQQQHYQTGKQHPEQISTFSQTVTGDIFCACHLRCGPTFSRSPPNAYMAQHVDSEEVTLETPCQSPPYSKLPSQCCSFEALGCIAAVAEHDAALRQNSTSAQELSQMRESSSALQQQLHVLTLEKQAELEKAVKVVLIQVKSTRRKGKHAA